jgi:hypothetical protein
VAAQGIEEGRLCCFRQPRNKAIEQSQAGIERQQVHTLAVLIRSRTISIQIASSSSKPPSSVLLRSAVRLAGSYRSRSTLVNLYAHGSGH